MHFGPAKAFLEAGIHVICDKPLTIDAGRCAGAGGRSAEERREIPAHAQLHRLSAGAAGAGNGGVGALGKIRVVQAEYPQDWLTEAAVARQQAGGLAHRSEAVGRRRRHRRYRHPRLQSRCASSPGLQDRGGERRPHELRAGPPARRQRPHHAALPGRRARHAVGEPGGGRQRERPAAARLRRKGRPRMAAGQPELHVVHRVRQAQAAADPRRRHLGVRRRRR